MKKLEELGISPWPWEYEGDSENTNSFDVICHLASGIRYQVAAPYIHMSGMTDENAHLITASPDMYEALWDLLFGDNGTANCRKCKGAELGNCKTCHLGKARFALEKAAGEDVAK